jgi:spore coat protein U-like protein
MTCNRALISAMFALAILLLASAPGYAQSCTASISTMNFGTIDLTANTAFDTTANFNVTCSGTANTTVRVCANILAGDGGASGTGDPRYLKLGANTVTYNLFQDGGHSSIWGNYTNGYGPSQIDVSINSLGTGSASRTVYGRIYLGQQSRPSGTYASNFDGSQAFASYDYSTAGDCLAIGGRNATAAAFTITASYPDTCTIAAAALAFGSIVQTTTATNGATTVTARCSAATPYTIGLNGGQAGTLDPANRKMKYLSYELTYGLYRESARTLPWGEYAGLNAYGGTGSGSDQILPVYGRVNAQPTPPAATYTDTVIATITY